MNEEAAYGVSERFSATDETSLAIERLSFLGYCLIDSGLREDELALLRTAFDSAKQDYDKRYGEQFDLAGMGENQTIRALPYHAKEFLTLLRNEPLRAVLEQIFGTSLALNQVNGLINPPVGETYSQGRWHRDLPYQHFVSSRPLAINALFCLDDFTLNNGATEVAVASHKEEKFPSSVVLDDLRKQVTAPAGHFIVLNAMTYHRGGTNRTDKIRRAVNHVYTIPMMRRQISLADSFEPGAVDDLEGLLNLGGVEPRSIEEWLRSRL